MGSCVHTFAHQVGGDGGRSKTAGAKPQANDNEHAVVHLQADSGARRQDAAKTRTLVVRVVDADGKPIQGARVFRNHVFKPTGANQVPAGARLVQIENKDYLTDAGGNAAVDLSGTSVDLRLWVTKAGFVPLHAMWAKQFQSDGDLIPEEFTFQLEHGTEIGGVVVDKEGEPTKGVKVEVRDPDEGTIFLGV